MSDNVPPNKGKQQQPRHRIQRKRSRCEAAASSSSLLKPRNQSLHDEQQQQQQQQQCTELSAVGHILSDEIYVYSSKHSSSFLSMGQVRQLSAWDNAVQKFIHYENRLVLENVKLSSELKKSDKAVSNLRNELVMQRTTTRRLRQETKELERNGYENKNESRGLQSASRFLTAVEKLGKACRDSA